MSLIVTTQVSNGVTKLSLNMGRGNPLTPTANQELLKTLQMQYITNKSYFNDNNWFIFILLFIFLYQNFQKAYSVMKQNIDFEVWIYNDKKQKKY